MSKITVKPTRKNPLRRVEVFVSEEEPCALCEANVQGHWVTTKFHKLRKGDIFRLWDTDDRGHEKPDQIEKGQHVTNVALSNARPKAGIALGIIDCMSVRGFTSRPR